MVLLIHSYTYNYHMYYFTGHDDVLMGTIATNNEDIAHSIQQEISGIYTNV